MSRGFGFTPTASEKGMHVIVEQAAAPQTPYQASRRTKTDQQADAVVAATQQPVSADLNATGATLVKIWDEICLKDDPAVRDLAAKMDKIVKGYSRGDTRLLPNWVETAQALSAANMAAKGPAIPAEFIMAPVVIARGRTEKGTPVAPPAVVVTVINTERPSERPLEKEVAVLVDGTQTVPNGAMAAETSADAPAGVQEGKTVESKFSWGGALLVGIPFAVWALS